MPRRDEGRSEGGSVGKRDNERGYGKQLKNKKEETGLHRIIEVGKRGKLEGWKDERKGRKEEGREGLAVGRPYNGQK